MYIFPHRQYNNVLETTAWLPRPVHTYIWWLTSRYSPSSIKCLDKQPYYLRNLKIIAIKGIQIIRQTIKTQNQMQNSLEL